MNPPSPEEMVAVMAEKILPTPAISRSMSVEDVAAWMVEAGILDVLKERDAAIRTQAQNEMRARFPAYRLLEERLSVEHDSALEMDKMFDSRECWKILYRGSFKRCAEKDRRISKLESAERDGRNLPFHSVMWNVVNGEVCRQQHEPSTPCTFERLESAPKAEPGNIPLGTGFEERKVQEIAAIRRSEKLPDMSQRVGAPKAEAPMTAEDFVRDLEADIHMLTGREAGRSPLITKAFIGAIRERDLSIAAAARKEAEDGMRAKFPLLSAKWLDPACREACRSLTIEHSRQALAEALRKAQPEADLLAISHRKTTGLRGTKCQACSHVWPCPTIRLLDSRAAALAAHGRDR